MDHRQGCTPLDHLTRRGFLFSAGAAAVGAMNFAGIAAADEQLKMKARQCVLFWQSGGVSQFESWDPKPGTQYGGPFAAIKTSVPGLHVCELLPHTAKQMHHLAVVRTIHTNENDHGLGSYMMTRGFSKTPGFDYPHVGSAFAKLIKPTDPELPGFVGNSGNSAAGFLGSKFAPVNVSRVADLLRPPKNMDAAADQRRRSLRDQINASFADGRDPKKLEIYNESYNQSTKLMARSDVFNFDKLPEKDLLRYGKSQFARKCIEAKMLLEKGITFVQVDHDNYDSHAINFDTHIRLLGQFDQPFAAFMEDIAASGLLEHTLVIVMGEFGRTPKINERMGRDHWGKCWSMALGGCGIARGAVCGKTNEKGTETVDGLVKPGDLFSTFYHAVGLDPHDEWSDRGRPIQKVEKHTDVIKQLFT